MIRISRLERKGFGMKKDFVSEALRTALLNKCPAWARALLGTIALLDYESDD